MALDLTGYFGGDPRPPLKRPGKEVEEELKHRDQRQFRKYCQLSEIIHLSQKGFVVS